MGGAQDLLRRAAFFIKMTSYKLEIKREFNWSVHIFTPLLQNMITIYLSSAQAQAAYARRAWRLGMAQMWRL